MFFKIIGQIQIILLIIIVTPVISFAQRGHISELRYKADTAIKHIIDLSPSKKQEYAEEFPAKKDSLRDHYLMLSKITLGEIERDAIKYGKYITPDHNRSLTRAHKVAGDDYFVALAETKKLQQLGLLNSGLHATDSLQMRKKINTIHEVDFLIREHEKSWTGSSAAEFDKTYKRHSLELELVKWLLGESELN